MSQAQIHQAKNNSHQAEDDVLLDKTSDDALERAADAGRTGAFTLGNCTGLGSCPA
jgi:hypothetical protein